MLVKQETQADFQLLTINFTRIEWKKNESMKEDKISFYDTGYPILIMDKVHFAFCVVYNCLI